MKGKELEEVQDFKYLGSFISADSNIDREVPSRIGQAAQAFKRLNNCRDMENRKRLDNRIRGLEGRCLRRILRNWWEQNVTNRDVLKRAGINDIVQEVKKRRWIWLCHVPCMKDRHLCSALTWAPPGKRGRG